MDKTFSETQGIPAFDWHLALDKAMAMNSQPLLPLEKASFFLELESRSSDWVTCACGNQCAIIDRLNDKSPKDDSLYQYGRNFYEEVKAMDFLSAKTTLRQIELRSAFLIKLKLEELNKSQSTTNQNIE